MDAAGAAPATYEIKVKGELSDNVLEALGGTRPREKSTSILVSVPDSAALNAVILRVEDLALELISVTPVRSESDE